MIPFAESVRHFAGNLAGLPRYGAVALCEPQQQVDVWIEGRHEAKNVTRNNVVAALRPFTVGVMLDGDADAAYGETSSRLCVRERQSNRLLGVLHLRPGSLISVGDHRFQLFETTNSENYCVSRFSLAAYYLRENWRAKRRQRRNRYNFLMTPQDVRCSHVFYLCPRPVVLVTVEHEGSGNMFPMDLIGPTDSPYFSMALRLTSPAVKLMQQSRRMALASVPNSYKTIAYELGKHHNETHIGWDSLSFPLKFSTRFRLPVAEAAPRVREVEVEEYREVGSHMVFLTSTATDTPSAPDEKHLFHAFYDPGRFPLDDDVHL